MAQPINSMVTLDSIRAAQELIANYLQPTPLYFDPETGIYLKWENRQATGSFKIRGALNKVLTLEPGVRQRGLVTASAGNHGQGVALACQLTNSPAIVFASENAAPIKIKKMRELGATVHLIQGGYANAEQTAINYAQEKGYTWVSPYNDPAVIAGQGTLALEILQDVHEPTPLTWYVPVGGGGLLSGIAAAVRSLSPQTRLVGVQSEASAFFHALFHHRSQEDVVETSSLADGLAGAVEANSITIDLVTRLVDEIILVSEAEIATAVKDAWLRYGEMIEGSAAVALAAAQRRHVSGKIASLTPAKQRSLALISGGNIQPELHAQLVRSRSSEKSD